MSHQSTEPKGCRKAFEDRYGKARLLMKRGGTVNAEDVPADQYVDNGIQAKWEDWQECWSAAIASVKREPLSMTHIGELIVKATDKRINLLQCEVQDAIEIARAVEQAHGITAPVKQSLTTGGGEDGA